LVLLDALSIIIKTIIRNINRSPVQIPTFCVPQKLEQGRFSPKIGKNCVFVQTKSEKTASNPLFFNLL
jgi:hypothetical protein